MPFGDMACFTDFLTVKEMLTTRVSTITLEGTCLTNCCNGLYVKPLRALTHFTQVDATTIFFFADIGSGGTALLQDRSYVKLENNLIHQLLT